MEIKDILKNRRIDQGLTLKEVAEAVGVSEATVSRWESGDIANMKRDRIEALSRVLGVSPLVILGRSEGTPESLGRFLKYAERLQALSADDQKKAEKAIDGLLSAFEK